MLTVMVMGLVTPGNSGPDHGLSDMANIVTTLDTATLSSNVTRQSDRNQSYCLHTIPSQCQDKIALTMYTEMHALVLMTVKTNYYVLIFRSHENCFEFHSEKKLLWEFHW